MTTSLSPWPKFKAFTSGTNVPLSAGKLYTYAAGTTAPLATYTSSTGLSANTNPIILDINGEADVWLGNSAYKFLLKNSNDVTQPGWPVDNISRSSTYSELLSIYSDLSNASDSEKGDAYIGVRHHRTNAVGTTLDAVFETYAATVGTGLEYTADSTGVAYADTIINSACSDLPSWGGDIFIKKGTYNLTRSLKLVRNGTRLIFEDVVNTRLVLTLLGLNRGTWTTTTSYTVNDIAGAPSGNPYNGYSIYYVCLSAHTSGTFATDLAAGKWELWCHISVRANNCRVNRGVIYVTGGSVGIASEGVYDFRPDNGTYFSATGADTGIGLLLSSYNYSGVLTAGAYPHRIGNVLMSENYGAMLHPGAYLNRCIVAVGDQNGCTIDGATMMSDRCIDWGGGGGNSIDNSLLQSATGSSTASSTANNQEPYSGGVGIGIYHAGAFTIGSNTYIERFEHRARTTGSPGAKTLGMGGESDSCNNLFSTGAGSTHPSFYATTEGVSAFVTRNLVDTYNVNANSAVIPTDLLGRRISGNGASRINCTLEIQASAVVDGRRFHLAGNSWPVEIVEGSTAYFGKYGDRLIIGQQGSLGGVSNIKTYCSAAGFIYLSGLWHIEWICPWSLGGKTYSGQTFSANAQTLTLSAQVMDVDGGGGNRTGCLLPAPRGCGDELEIISQSLNTVAFVSGAVVVRWSSSGAPTVGVNAGNTISITLGSDSSGGWYEKRRAIK